MDVIPIFSTLSQAHSHCDVRSKMFYHAKGLVAILAPLHAQSAWESREERVRTAGLIESCNYLYKKKNCSIISNTYIHTYIYIYIYIFIQVIIFSQLS